jgi:hypothetical protein
MLDPLTLIAIGFGATGSSLVRSLKKSLKSKTDSYKIKVDDTELEVSDNKLTPEQIQKIINQINEADSSSVRGKTDD